MARTQHASPRIVAHTPPIPQHTPRSRFLQIGPRRVMAVVTAIRLLAHFADRNTYEVTADDRAKIKSVLQGELDAVMATLERGKAGASTVISF